YQRVKIDGTFYEIDKAPTLDKKFNHDIDVVVDRIVVRSDIATRLADSFEQALKLADGLAVIEFAEVPPSKTASLGAAPHPDPLPAGGERESPAKKVAKIHDQQGGPERLVFSEKFACPV